MFETLLSTASVDIRKSQVELGISLDAPLSEEFDYPFYQRTIVLNAYLISTLNTSLHDKAVGSEHHGGFKFYRQICEIMNAVREDAEFQVVNELTTLSRNFGAKATDLKSLYGFRLRLKKNII